MEKGWRDGIVGERRQPNGFVTGIAYVPTEIVGGDESLVSGFHLAHVHALLFVNDVTRTAHFP